MFFEIELNKKIKSPRIYIAKPNMETQRNLAGVETAKLRAYLNDIWEIQFDVSKYITNRKGQIKENPAYSLLTHSNEIKIDTLGWFRINTEPTENYSSDGRWYKTFTAYGYETTLQDIDLVGININCGTDDSLEMFEENLDEFGVPKHNIQLYIKEENNDPTSENYWMLGLLNILEHEYLSKKGWTIGSVEIGLSSLRGRQFEISSMNAYRFLTCEIPAAYKCMPIFDRVNKVINFVKLETLGKDLNIEFNLRNFVNDVVIEDSNEDYFNCFHVAGSDKEAALIEYINYGTNLLRNIKYPIETGQVSDSIATKYSAYEEFIESNREAYADYTRQYLKLSEERSNLYDLMPVDEVDVLYTNTSDEELQTELLHFQTIVSLLEELHTVDGVLQIEGTNDYPLYISSKDVMIPKIQAEITARTNGKHADTFDYSINWELYGINELESRKTAYERQLDVLAEKGYDKAWTENLGTSQAAHEKQHNLYLEYAGYVTAINVRLNKLNTRVTEIDALIETNTASQNELAAKAKITHEYWGFTDDELATLNVLFRETDFQDSTIEILDTDTIDDIISLAWDLLESAKEELEIESRPQNTYSISLDNFFRHAKFMKKANSLSIGDFCWLGLDNGFHTKQRIIEMELELVNFNDNDVSLTFSDVVTVCGKADDYRFILENQNSSSKNTLSRETKEYISKNIGTFASQILDKYFNSGGNSYFTYGISAGDVQKLQDALDGLIGGELSLDDLKVKLAQIDTLEANSAFIQYLNTHYLVGEQADFTELKAKLAAIDNLLAGNVSAELAHVIKLTADNVLIDEAVIKQLIASQILVSDLKAGDITLSDTMRILSENGLMVMNGKTLQISGKDSAGNEYVAIQLGYDAQNNPSLIIRNETGAIMLDAEGLHPEIVPDQFIKTDMIADKSVTEAKIDKTNILEWTDDDGNKIFDTSRMYFGDDKFEVVYSSFKEKTENDISSVSGKINSLEETIGKIEADNAYFYVRYSANADGSAMTIEPNENTLYMGTCSTASSTAPSDYTEYTWLRIKGADGTNGTPGATGADGKSQYFHIKYSDDGSTFTSNYGETLGEWMGTCVTENEADPTDFDAYEWYKIKGEDGVDGSPGKDGDNGVSTYFYVRYSANPNGNPMTSTPENDTKYMGVCSTTESTAPTDYNIYEWTQCRGNDGTNGTPGAAGADGKTQYLHLKYSDDGTTFTSNNGETIGAWIGTLVDFNETDSTTFSDYTWKKFTGDIEIGGRNLILESESKSHTRSNASSNMLVDFMWNNSDYGIELLKKGGKFTISFDYIITGITTTCNMRLDLIKADGTGHTTSIITIPLSVGDNSGRCETTFTPSEGLSDVPVKWKLTNIGAGSNQNAVFTFNHIKLEKGNVATDWTPAPEDVETEIGNINTALIENTTAITQAKMTIDQISKEIGLEVSGNTVSSYISGMKSDIEDATVGIDKWLVEVYPKSTLPEENRGVLDFSAFYGQDINPSFQYIVSDAEISTSLGYGTGYIGYALTFVNFSSDAEVSTSFYKVTSGTLYLNGIRCSDESGSTADETVTLYFKNGWNVLEVIWSVDESATSDGFGFDILISELEKCSIMNCYYRTITGRDCFMQTKTAGININLNSITSKVEEVSSEISNKADGTTVNELSEKVSEVEQSVNTYKVTVGETYATKDGLNEVNEAVLTLEKNMISTVINSEEFSSNITQAKNYWKTEFQNDGAVCGSTTITKDGITVTGSDDTVGITVIGSTAGMYETRITPMEFSGSYNGQKVFWLNEDETVTRRLYVENGISLGYIKIVPVEQNDIGGIDFLGASAQLL